MKEIIIILLALGTIGLQAQESESRLYIGAYFSADAADIRLENTNGSQVSDYLIDLRNESESHKFGYSSGLTIAYTLSDHFSIESGFVYGNKGYQTKKLELTFGQMIDPRQGFVFTTSESGFPSQVQSKYNFEYIGIPIALHYVKGEGKWKFNSTISLTAEYLVNATRTFLRYYEDDKTERDRRDLDDDFKEFNLSPSIAAGVSYQIGNNMFINAMPTARFGVLQIIDAPISGYLYSTGIQLGWQMSL